MIFGLIKNYATAHARLPGIRVVVPGFNAFHTLYRQEFDEMNPKLPIFVGDMRGWPGP